jgi:hypothetical protein
VYVLRTQATSARVTCVRVSHRLTRSADSWRAPQLAPPATSTMIRIELLNSPSDATSSSW